MNSDKWEDKTRGGNPVRIYAEDGSGPFPIQARGYEHTPRPRPLLRQPHVLV